MVLVFLKANQPTSAIHGANRSFSSGFLDGVLIHCVLGAK
jgi:hypothetical protein